jgi:pimeloyl-ACP methyl ester carboxylesterase
MPGWPRLAKLLAMLTMSRDRRLVLERTGTGTPRVIALHGWGRGRQDWLPVLDGIASLIPDLPGFGLNAPPPGVWGAREYAEFLRPLLEEADRPILVGHSFGGRVAVCLAAIAPDSVCGLVLTGAPLVRLQPSSRPRPMFRAARRLNKLGLLPDETMNKIRYRYGSQDYRLASGVMRQVLVKVVNESYEDELAAVTAPAALVWGSGDTEVPVAVARSAAQLMPAATVDVVDRGGHLLQGDLSNQVRAAVEAKLRTP